MNPIYKMMLAEAIISECHRLNVQEMIEPMWYPNPANENGIAVLGEPLPGYLGEEVTDKEIELSATMAAPYELWWCRAVAKQNDLSPKFMDKMYYNQALDNPLEIVENNA